MIVKDVMIPVNEVLRGYDFLDSAARTMKRLGSKRLPVLDHSQIVGILSDQSIGGVGTTEEKDLAKIQVRNAMMAGEMTCPEHLTIQETIHLLERMHKSCLVVLSSQGRAIGIVSEEDIALSYGRPAL